MSARYEIDKAGLGRYLRQSRDLWNCVQRRARYGAQVARAIAPSRSGRYIANIHVEGARRPRDGRVMAYIVADAPHAVQVEHGRTKTKPYQGGKVMTRMAEMLNEPRRPRKI